MAFLFYMNFVWIIPLEAETIHSGFENSSNFSIEARYVSRSLLSRRVLSYITFKQDSF